jgi:hypothetical protein
MMKIFNKIEQIANEFTEVSVEEVFDRWCGGQNLFYTQ